VHLVGFIIEIYYDAQSYECQICQIISVYDCYAGITGGKILKGTK